MGNKPVPAVRDRGQITPDGWQPENAAWLDVLAPVGAHGRREGVDPMAIDCDTLTAAGHPRRGQASDVIGALRGIPVEARAWRFTNLRDHCFSCAENGAEVRRCACIECPVWPYRMGRNPHHPKRGKNPFSAEKTRVGTAPAGNSDQSATPMAETLQEAGK